MKQGFRKYNNLKESFYDYIDFLLKNKHYKDVLAASTIGDAIHAQAKSGYATDPKYGHLLEVIIKQYG
jgi:flagellar protein FlgJ